MMSLQQGEMSMSRESLLKGLFALAIALTVAIAIVLAAEPNP